MVTTRPVHIIFLTLGLVGVLISQTALTPRLTTFCVNQGGTSGCFGTITDAIAAASDGDTITIAGAPNPYLEHLTITKSLNLVGESAANTIIDGSLNGQVVRITTAVTVTLTNLTIRNGQAGEGDMPGNFGGGIHLENGTLALNKSIVSGNRTGGANYCCGGNGGGISNQNGKLTLNDTVVSDNHTASALDNNTVGGLGGSGGRGGGIYNEQGTLVLNRSTVSYNTTGAGAQGGGLGGVGGDGGGIATSGGTVVLNYSTVVANTTGNGGLGGSPGGNGGNGGGIYNIVGKLIVDHSTINANQTGAGAAGVPTSGVSGNGGGLIAIGSNFINTLQVTVTTSTISGNSTGLGLLASVGGNGGGIYSILNNAVSVSNSTIAFNQVDADQTGGGIGSSSASVSIQNTLLAYNTNRNGPNFIQDCSGTLASLGYNVITEPDCTISAATGDKFYVRGTILLPLGNNGGPTQTHALVPGSPAIDAANDSACPATDQRGFPRPAFGGVSFRCDVGAYELQQARYLPIILK